MDTNYKVNCPACNTPYQVIYYQRRAADEPPDKVTFCSNCPVDTSKLSIIEPTISTSVANTKRPISAVRHTRSYSSNSNSILTPLESRMCIYVEGAAAQRCYKQQLEAQSTYEPIIVATIPIQISKAKKLTTLYFNSILQDKALITLSSSKIAPFVQLSKVHIFQHKQQSKSFRDKHILGYEYQLPLFQHVEKSVLRLRQKNKQPYMLLLLDKIKSDNDNDEDIYLSVLQQILYTYGTETSIKSFIDARTISLLYVQSARAFDWASAPNEGYKYTWKPDGERFWYIKYGSVWIFSRRLLSGRITGWNIANSIINADKAGPILDVEVMIAFPPILIDVLALESGMPTSALRTLPDVLDIFKQMKSIDIPIHIRDYFNTEAELLSTKHLLEYPIDGSVGIEDGGMTIIKLKSVKSIELKLEQDGSLTSAEGTQVATSDLQSIYPINSIIEIRFTKKSDNDTVYISESILRTDKTKANEYSVCQDILRIISVMPYTLARRKALLWCNSVRQKIHQIGANFEGKGRVILDIGSGDGQAISDYSNNPEVTYILIEPVKSKAMKLSTRLSDPTKGKHMYLESAQQIGKAISSVAKGLVKYAIINSTIEEVLQQENSIRMLKACVRCCIASFSISHTLDSLLTLAYEGFHIIGCGYLYNNIENGEFLINESGVKMKKQNNIKASVKWGNDTMYTERPINSADFKDVFYEKLASTTIPLIKDNETSLLNIISSKVYIVSTKRNI